jgi:hypothetical protein
MPSDAIEFIDTFQNEGYISIDEEQRIRLTDKGKSSVANLQKKINSAATKDISDSFISKFVLIESNLEVFQPYIPNKGFYEKYLKERSEKEVRE